MTRVIIPGIQEKAFPEIKRKIHLVEPFVNWVQIDVTDKTLTENESFRNPSEFEKINTKVNLEVHLMTMHAASEAKDWIKAGFKRAIVQIESANPEKFANGENNGVEKGLALDGPSGIEQLLPYISKIDFVLIMMYKTGPSGQIFEPVQLEKVRYLRQRYPKLPIEVDGGINSETILLAEKAGTDRFVATSAIFKSDNIENAIKELQGVM